MISYSLHYSLHYTTSHTLFWPHPLSHYSYIHITPTNNILATFTLISLSLTLEITHLHLFGQTPICTYLHSLFHPHSHHHFISLYPHPLLHHFYTYSHTHISTLIKYSHRILYSHYFCHTHSHTILTP